MEHKHDDSPGPDLRVVQNSPEVGERSSSSGTDEHRSIATPLQVPAINILVGSPPLRMSETAAIVEGSEVVEDANNPSASGEDELGGDMISLSEATTVTNEQQKPTMKRQGSDRKSRSARLGNSSRRARSAERPSVSNNSSPTKPSAKPTSERVSRKSIDSSAGLLPTTKKPSTRDRSPERSVTANKPSLSNNTSTSDSDDDPTPSSVVAHKKLDMDSRSVASSKSSTSLSSSQQLAAADDKVANNQPACTVGEKVMVETPNGFKFGNVKFVGPTEFAAGEWIGVALERPNGEWYPLVTVYYYCYHIRKTRWNCKRCEIFQV